MWCRTAVVDAVAARELVYLAAELELHFAVEHYQELFRVAVCVRLGPRRPAGIELADEDLEIAERTWSQEALRAEDAERK
jgi:hypothetical protein